MNRIINIIKFFIIIIFIGCNSSKDSEWIYMFDGKTTDGWRGYINETMPKKCEVIYGELTFNTEFFQELSALGALSFLGRPRHKTNRRI